MTVLSLICALFGCQKAPKGAKPAKHDLSEITAVSIFCGNMDRSYGYSFCAQKKENSWFLDVECFTQNFEEETAFESRELDRDDAKELLEILKQSESIAYVENYKKSKIFAFHVADEETYGFCLTFSDGNRYVTSSRHNDLEKFFYRLAKKYGE